MKQFPLFLLFVFLFFFSIFLGFTFRLIWFLTYQKYLVEKDLVYKPLIEAKGGGNTPQEAWIGYLNALEKGDIEGALEYIWPEEREKIRKSLLEAKSRGYLEDPAHSFSRMITKVENPERFLDKDEVMYVVKVIINKTKSLARAEDKETKEFLELLYKDKPEIFESEETIIFKFNPYSKKWLIKE